MITIRRRKEPAPDQRRTVRLEGHEIGSPVSLFLVDVEPGRGSELHIHPYAETWIVQSGEVEFKVGEETVHGSAGDVVVGPAHVPHRFTNVGTGRLELVAIHPSATIQQINVQGVLPGHC